MYPQKSFNNESGTPEKNFISLSTNVLYILCTFIAIYLVPGIRSSMSLIDIHLFVASNERPFIKIDSATAT